ncbi:MAG TPA: GNAT family N-acetyltransferase [Woeseiaceae bacterium]|nr:GNAT family N-acetyltransferase [Woeseiaceae bacterium]
MATGIRIETPRLIMRNIDPARDFEGWSRLVADEETVRFIGGLVMDRALAWRNMAMVLGHWQLRGYGFFSVEDKATGEWLGRVGPWNPEGWPAPEVGWAIRREYWGKGYATEAGRAAIEYASRVLGWKEVIHVILPGNERSIAVAEKLGSRFLRKEKSLPGVTDKEVLVYGQNAP